MINYDKDPQWDPYNQGDHDFSANLTIDDVWVLYYSVNEAFQNLVGVNDPDIRTGHIKS